MKGRALQNTVVLKAKLKEVYFSFCTDQQQLQLFSGYPSHTSVKKGRTEKLLHYCRTLIDNGFNPTTLFVAINQLERDNEIVIALQFQFNSMSQFLDEIEKTRHPKTI